MDLKPVDLEEIGLDYAATLSKWRNSVQERYDGVVELGFDESFVRPWDMHLSHCPAAFLERRLSDVQLTSEVTVGDAARLSGRAFLGGAGIPPRTSPTS
jgi:cyclopropane fatty-acyl-phospholipid synthase-like methyltransferase